MLLIGIVDQIDGDLVSAEVTTTGGATEYLRMHKDMIPCVVSEGDMFYFAQANGVVEIRCGEPPI